LYTATANSFAVVVACVKPVQLADKPHNRVASVDSGYLLKVIVHVTNELCP
jgi:hypothetical protein